MSLETDQETKVYTCKYCGQEFPSTIKRANHIRAKHRAETQAEREAEREADEVSTSLGGLPPEELGEKALEFAEALDAAAPSLNAKTRKQMLLAYDDDSDSLSKDAQTLENFLDDYDLRRRQQRQIVRQLFGTRREGPGAISGIPGLEVRQTPWGPALIVSQGQGGERDTSTRWSGGETVEQARAQARMEGRLERIEEKIGAGDKGPKEGTREPSPPPMRKGYRPVLDKDGNLVYDKDGDITYEQYEEPWEPGARDTMSEMLLPVLLRQLTERKDPPKEIDEEALALKIRDKIGPSGGEGDSKTLAAVEALTKTVDGMQAARETERLIEAATGPLKEQLAAAQGQLATQSGFKGLSDAQAHLRTQSQVVDTVVGVVSEHLGGIREDLRPLVLQQAVQGLRAQGLGDEVIGQFLSAMRERVPTGTISESAKREALARVKAWAG